MPPRRRELALPDGAEHVAESFLHRGPAGQQVVERRAQAVDVGPRAEVFQVSLGLLGAHVSRRAQRRPGSVSAEPLAEELGTSVLLRPRRARIGPVALASPQSTTRVSPCLPTMMLAGLMSRWSTPRLWA